MSTTNQRLNLDAKTAMAILNGRKTITRADVGHQVMAVIQGSGTYLIAEEQRENDLKAGKQPAKQYFDKYIYNLKANSAEAISRKETKALFTAAVKAESAGDVEEANKLFNQWLNAVQVSFNVIADRARKLESGDAVTCFVGEADTASGHKALVVNDVRYKAPAELQKVVFDLTDLMAEEAPATGEEIKAGAVTA